MIDEVGDNWVAEVNGRLGFFVFGVTLPLACAGEWQYPIVE
jgi:hypothetical protein